jgi:hypothetical protein
MPDLDRPLPDKSQPLAGTLGVARAEWRMLNRLPLFGVGAFEGTAGAFELTLPSIGALRGSAGGWASISRIKLRPKRASFTVRIA